MVRIYFTRIKPEKVDVLRAWMDELVVRREESIEAMENDTIRSEAAYLLETGEGPILVHGADIVDLQRAEHMRFHSKLPLAEDYRRVMREVMVEPMEVGSIFELDRGV